MGTGRAGPRHYRRRGGASSRGVSVRNWASMSGISPLGKPSERLGFRIPNPRVLLIRVGVRIVGMEVARATLFLLIGAGRVRMRAQIVPESDVTLDLRRIRAEEVKLHDAIACPIGKRAIAPSGYAELAVPSVAKRLDTPTLSVKVGLAASPGTDVEPI